VTVRTANADRLWIIGGALIAVALLAMGWFFAISPQNSETDRLREEAAAAQDRLAPLRARLAELKAQNVDLARYQDQLKRDRQALPTVSGMSDFLRQQQVAGDQTGVQVTGYALGAASQVNAAGAKLQSLPVTLTVKGPIARMGAFLDQLQLVQPRAVLVTGVSVSPDENQATLGGSVQLALNLQVFVAPDAAEATPQPTPGPTD
jgi:Tfp pilus assembly protein PilO